MEEVFKIIRKWIGEETEVITFMSDFQVSARTPIQLVFPYVRRLCCSTHMQRDLGLFAINRSVYRDPTQNVARSLMEKAYVLPFFPEEHVAHAIDCLAQQIPETGAGKSFGTAVIAYVRKQWLPAKMSVANEEVRCNNRSEIFHWTMLRADNPLQRNPYEFLQLLQSMNFKISNEINQWNHLIQSRKQMVEDVHKKMVRELQPEIERD